MASSNSCLLYTSGIVNLGAHIENMHKYGVPVVVAINRFGDDTQAELEYVENYCRSLGADFALSEVFAKGGEGGRELAEKVCAAAEQESHFQPIYPDSMPLREKIETIAREIYGADGVTLTPAAQKSLKEIEALGAGNLPVCIAKTQYSLSDNPALLGRPSGFMITVRDLRLSNGAGFVVAYAGDIMTMPGLPKVPAAERIGIGEEQKITGLF